MKPKIKAVSLVVSEDQYRLFQEEQARLNIATGVKVSMSQTIIRAATREIKGTK